MLGDRRFAEPQMVVEPVGWRTEPGDVLDAVAGLRDPIFLDSAAGGPMGRYSVLACMPLQVLTLREGVLSLRDSRGPEQILAEKDNEAIWRALAQVLGQVQAVLPDSAPPYCPGWYGYVGYEVGRHIERLPGRAVGDISLPDLRLGFHDAVFVHDRADGRWTLLRLNWDSPPPDAGLAADALWECLTRAVAARDLPQPASLWQGVEKQFSRQQYEHLVARCVEYIRAGDIFQVNLSQRFTVPDAPLPADIYRALRQINPADFAAFLHFSDGLGPHCAVLSSSPELFLQVRGQDVLTMPIKGTRPRTGDARADAAAAKHLLGSPKDNAELAMIIDLLRNDLGRVCRYGSVRVTAPRQLQTHPTVLHLVGEVRGELRPGVGPADLLRATFPGGSITGAPKVRAMEIIDELEPQARGVYTGCIGFVGVAPVAQWNIAIRTIVHDGWAAYAQAGGGIVADSDPAAEYQETIDKVQALLAAIAIARESC